MRYKIAIALLTISSILAVAAIVSTKTQVSDRFSKTIKINNATLNIIYARTDQEMAKGLGYRESLDANTGMLFVNNSPKILTFWMQGMRFPLDFIWIEKNQIADITENVPPPSQTNNQPVVVQPKVPVSLVLEVNAGWIAAHNVKVGDQVIFAD